MLSQCQGPFRLHCVTSGIKQTEVKPWQLWSTTSSSFILSKQINSARYVHWLSRIAKLESSIQSNQYLAAEYVFSVCFSPQIDVHFRLQLVKRWQLHRISSCVLSMTRFVRVLSYMIIHVINSNMGTLSNTFAYLNDIASRKERKTQGEQNKAALRMFEILKDWNVFRL